MNSKLKTFLNLALVILSVTSCKVDGSDIIGTYNSPELRYYIDTLRIYTNGIYQRNLYYKSGELIFSQSDSWSLDKSGRLNLDNLVINFDKTVYSQKQLERRKMSVGIFAKTSKDKIKLHYGPFEHDRYYFLKLD